MTEAFKQKLKAFQAAAHALEKEWALADLAESELCNSEPAYDEAFSGVSFDEWCFLLDAWVESAIACGHPQGPSR